jgi:hypothetical protein
LVTTTHAASTLRTKKLAGPARRVGVWVAFGPEGAPHQRIHVIGEDRKAAAFIAGELLECEVEERDVFYCFWSYIDDDAALERLIDRVDLMDVPAPRAAAEGGRHVA